MNKSAIIAVSTESWTARARLYASAAALTACFYFVARFNNVADLSGWMNLSLSSAVVLLLCVAGAEAYLVVRYFQSRIADAERARLRDQQEQAARTLHQQQAINRIAAVILEKLDLAHVPDEVLADVAEMFGAEVVAVWVADKSQPGTFGCRGVRGLTAHTSDQITGVAWTLPVGAPGAPPTPLILSDAPKEWTGALQSWAQKEQIGAGVLTPMLRRDEGLGWLGVFYRRPPQLAATDTAGMQTVAQLLAGAVQAEALYHDLVRMQKIESVGTLASGIAHDFNNILAAILACASYCKQYADPASQVFRYLEATEESAQRGAALTKQLLSFVRREEPRLSVVNVNEHIEQTLKMLERSLDKSILVQKQLARELPPVEVDASMLEQVILNIAVNARDAMPTGGFFIVSTRQEVLSQRRPRRPNINLPDGDYVVLGFRDTGQGMDAATRQRIFEPFFTTERPGKGTGLGLSLILNIVHNFGGEVCVESELGVGTQFEVYLPASTKPLPASAPKGAPVVRGGGECILIAEDEDIIREMAQLSLEAKGYKVIAAADGAAAVARYREAWQKVDLVLADMAMPRLSGPEVIEAMKKINPHVRVVVSSGYSQDREGQRMLHHGCLGFLQKPYNAEQLCQTVRSILDSGL